MSRTLQMAIFLGVIILVLVVSHIYFYSRLIRDPAWPSPWRIIGKWVIISLAVSVPLTFWLSRILNHSIAKILLFIPYLWMGMLLLICFFLLCADFLKLLSWLGLKIAGAGEFFENTGRQILRNRIIAGSVMAITLLLTMISVFNAFSTPIVRRVQIRLDRLPSSFNGFTIAHLSDLHLGPILNRSFLEQVVRLTNHENPDLVAITGDLVDGPVDLLLPALQPLSQLNAPHGIFLVTGNHEFYAGLNSWLPVFEKLGIQILQNQRVPIVKDGAVFDLAGIHDPQGKSFSPEHAPDLSRALNDRKSDREVILLSHQTLIINQAEKMNVGLVLSGHNHGGQIWPWMHLVGLQQPYLSGLHRQGQTLIYVSEGTGFWGPPMRLGTRSEITIITLQVGSKY